MARIDKYNREHAPAPTGHFMTHIGRLFFADVPLVAVATATTVDIGILTDATHEAHLCVHAKANQGIQTLSLIEAPTGVTGGSAITPTQKNRNSAISATTVIKNGVTGTTGGTTLPLPRILAASEVDLSGQRPESEFVLKANTQYVLRVVTGALGTNELDFEMEWYENVGQGVDKSQG